jgi:hypothetical protein
MTPPWWSQPSNEEDDISLSEADEQRFALQKSEATSVSLGSMLLKKEFEIYAES